MARKSRVIPLLLLAVFPSVSWALGLGEIDLQSALNQPLKAEIAIVGASGDELAGLKVNLASREAFERLGLDKPAFLNSLTFTVDRNAAGAAVIKVSSGQPMTEPFVTFLLEAKWARGSLLREYTVLLDPPSFIPEAASPAPAPAVSAPAPDREPARTSGTVLRQPESVPVVPTTAPERAPYTAPAGSHRVNRGDTLWEVADQYRPAGVSVNQMMIALYEANPDAFTGNINRLRAGSILRIPPVEDLRAISVADADNAVRVHNESWRPGSGMVGPRVEPKLRLVAPTDEQAGSAGATQPGAAGQSEAEASALRDEVDRLQRELDTAEDRLQVQSEQMAALQSSLEQTARAQAEAEAQPAGQLQPEAQQTAPGQAASEETVSQEPGPQETAQEEAKPSVKKVISAPRQESSWLDLLLSPLALVLVGALVLIAAVLVFLRRRKSGEGEQQPWEDLDDEGLDETDVTVRSATASATITQMLGAKAKAQPGFVVQEDKDYGDTANLEADVFESAGSATGLDTTTVEPSGKQRGISVDETVHLEDTTRLKKISPDDDGEVADPVAEADFHMAYGLYDQAAEILEAATGRNPDNAELQMKLAEVYFVWGNEKGFREVAGTIRNNREQVGEGNWEKILIMGKQLLPGDDMFSEIPEGRAGTDMDISIEDSGLHAALDMELMGDETAVEDTAIVDLDFGSALDFVGDTQESSALDIGEEETRESLAMDIGEGDTQETPMLDVGEGDTQETPVLDVGEGDTQEMEIGLDDTHETSFLDMDLDVERDSTQDTVETPIPDAERTAEIDLDDLGLDVSLDDSFIGRLPDDFDGPAARDSEGETAIMDTRASSEDLGDEEATLIARPDDTGELAALAEELGEAEAAGVDFDLGGDPDSTGSADELDQLLGATAEMTSIIPAQGGQDTTEVPVLDADESMELDLGTLTHIDGMTEAEGTVELEAQADSELEMDLDVSDMTMPESEALTLSEIGTKLDLARAYMDMGDPDGARSILEEVIAEGDEAQQVDAKRLLGKLP